MKKKVWLIALVAVCLLVPTGKASAQIPVIDIIKAGIKKVIKAIDLKIQREQNRIIWLQNAQKTVENTMSKLKLNEIGDWVQKQKELYKEYYEELAKVKSLISMYQRVRDITRQQIAMIDAYKRAWALLKQDTHFTPEELDYMARVYTGIIDESVKNLEQIALVANSFTTTMTDAKRLEIMNDASDRLDENYSDLTRFNNQNALLSIQRAKTLKEAEGIRKLYGL